MRPQGAPFRESKYASSSPCYSAVECDGGGVRQGTRGCGNCHSVGLLLLSEEAAARAATAEAAHCGYACDQQQKHRQHAAEPLSGAAHPAREGQKKNPPQHERKLAAGYIFAIETGRC